MKGHFVSVTGNSMYPAILPDDRVFIEQKDKYDVGDILVFNYQSEQCLIHRLLFCANNCYYCKGDNSFRIEGVTYQSILGKVKFILRRENIILPENMSSEFIRRSLKVGLNFYRAGNNRDEIINSTAYIEYKQHYNGGK